MEPCGLRGQLPLETCVERPGLPGKGGGALFSQEPGTGVHRGPKHQECVHLPIDLDQSACCCKARAPAGEGEKEEREAGRGEEPRILT